MLESKESRSQTCDHVFFNILSKAADEPTELIRSPEESVHWVPLCAKIVGNVYGGRTAITKTVS